MSSILYPNRHTLFTKTQRAPVPCWRIGHLIELRGRLNDVDYMREVHNTTPEAALAQWSTTKNSDYPNGLTHDSTCTTCKGSGLMNINVVVGYECSGCGLEGDLKFFDSLSCLQRGAGALQELRACHEMGEHDDIVNVRIGDGPMVAKRMDRRRCPLCIERRMIEEGRKVLVYAVTS